MRQTKGRLNYLILYYRRAKNSGSDLNNAAYQKLREYSHRTAYRVSVLNKKDRPHLQATAACLLLEGTMLMLLERAYEKGDDLSVMNDLVYFYEYIKHRGKDKLYAELDELKPSNLGYLPMHIISYAPKDREHMRAADYELLLSDLKQLLENKEQLPRRKATACTGKE